MKYEVDLKNSFIDYLSQTRKKYFKIALNYAIENKIDCVKVNRIYYDFDFNNLKVRIGTLDDFTTYKLKIVDE